LNASDQKNKLHKLTHARPPNAYYLAHGEKKDEDEEDEEQGAKARKKRRSNKEDDERAAAAGKNSKRKEMFQLYLSLSLSLSLSPESHKLPNSSSTSVMEVDIPKQLRRKKGVRQNTPIQ